jgi:hypothetical protein
MPACILELCYSRADSIVAQPVRQLPAAILKSLVGELNPERPAAALAAIPWGQNVLLLQKLKDPLLRL